MNNNRNNNRRRGRGNNRGQGGGGNQANRIDSRARGNAPQLLEKFKKLAHDASLNGDRVQTEYYLQFADHYFRVLAASKAPKDETRVRRDAERESSDDDYDDEDDDRQDVQEQQPRGRNSRGGRGRDDNDSGDSDDAQRASDGDEDGGPVDEENPFVREARPRASRPRRRTKPANDSSGEQGEFDPGVLPPSISRAEGEKDAAEEAPPAKPARTRTRRPRPAQDGDGEALEAVS